MPKITLPGPLKKIPPIGWVIIAGVVLAIIYLKMKGTGASASAGLTSGGGGGGTSASPLDSGNPAVIPETMPTTPIGQPGPTELPIGGGPGTTSPLAGLPGAYNADPSSPYAVTPTPQGVFTIPQAVAARMQQAIEGQAAAQAQFGGGEGVHPDTYGRGQALDFLAQLQYVVDTGRFIPNASGPGLTFTPGAEGQDASGSIMQYQQQIQQLYGQWGFSPDEVANATQRLTSNLAQGISLAPGTSYAVGVENAGKNTYGNTPAPSGQGGSPTISTGQTVGTVRTAVSTITTSQMLAAIKARSPGASAAQIQKTLTNDLAKGYTPAQIVK